MKRKWKRRGEGRKEGRSRRGRGLGKSVCAAALVLAFSLTVWGSDLSVPVLAERSVSAEDADCSVSGQNTEIQISASPDTPADTGQAAQEAIRDETKEGGTAGKESGTQKEKTDLTIDGSATQISTVTLADTLGRYIGHVYVASEEEAAAAGDAVTFARELEQETAAGEVDSEISVASARQGTFTATIVPDSVMIHYYDWSTCMFTVVVDGQAVATGMCTEPGAATSSGSASAYLWQDDVVKALMLCMPGAAWANSHGKNLFTYDNDLNTYALIHAAVSYRNNPSFTQGLPDTEIAEVQNRIASVEGLLRDNASAKAELDEYTLYIARFGNSQDICWIEHDNERGGISLQKASDNPAMTEGNSCYSLKGAEYSVCKSGSSEVVGTITTDAEGKGSIENLPVGEYEVVETKAPEGYLLDETRYQVTVNGGIFTYCSCTDTPGNDPVDLVLLKRDAVTGTAQGGATLAGALYTVKYYDTNSSTDPAASGKQAKYSWVLKTDSHGRLYLDPDYKVSGDDFLKIGDTVVIPVGTLTIQETTAPEGYLLDDTVYVANTLVQEGKRVITFNLPNEETYASEEKVIRGDLEWVKLKDSSNEPLAGVPFTITSLSTGESHILVSDVNGKVSTAAGWNPHSQNTNRGSSSEDGIWFGQDAEVDDSLGALPYDTYRIQEQACQANEGLQLVDFTVQIYRNDTTVNLEGVRDGDLLISTRAFDAVSGSKALSAGKDSVIADVISYSGLTPGHTYQAETTLADAETGQLLTVDDITVSGKTEFTPAQSWGTEKVTLQVDSSEMTGRQIVVFEKIYEDGELVAEHCQLNDQEQTVSVASIGTSAADGTTGTRLGAAVENTTLVDTVSYQGLNTEETYTLIGSLYSRETGEQLLVNGSPVTASAVFTPQTSDGSQDIVFCFDATGLMGSSVVVFEELQYDGLDVAVHADLGDEDQTITYPAIATSAKIDGSKTAKPSDTVTLTDLVEYENLQAGTEYTLKGVLMDRESGSALKINGKEVTAQMGFTPTESSGSQEMIFEFSAAELGGKSLVVFEELYLGDILIAEHADPESQAQTVTILTTTPTVTPTKTVTPTPTASAGKTSTSAGSSSVKTGDNSRPGMWILLLLAAASVLGMTLLVSSRKR